MGLGLQKVVSNIVSGVIILLERSISPGDVISLGDVFGSVRELRARFVSVVTNDGREHLIPNEQFVTGKVTNWSFNGHLVQINVVFSVSREEHPRKIERLALVSTVLAPTVAREPPPECWLTGFNDTTLDFAIRFWIREREHGPTEARGRVLLALWETFQDNGIWMPISRNEVTANSGDRRLH